MRHCKAKHGHSTRRMCCCIPSVPPANSRTRPPRTQRTDTASRHCPKPRRGAGHSRARRTSDTAAFGRSF
eukprot:1975057-Alexandrium_andersonii.AAC.1